MKFYILAMVLVLNSNTAFAEIKKIPQIIGRIVDSSSSNAKPIRFAKIKICSTTKNVPCNEYTANEDGKFAAHEVANDTYIIYINGVPKNPIEVKTEDIELPLFVIISGGSSPIRAKAKALK